MFTRNWCNWTVGADRNRLASPTMLKFALAEANHNAYTTHLFYSKTHLTPYTALPYEYGQEQTRSGQRLSATYAGKPRQITTRAQMRHTGSHTALAFSQDTPSTIF